MMGKRFFSNTHQVTTSGSSMRRGVLASAPNSMIPMMAPTLFVAKLSDSDYAIQDEAHKQPRVVSHNKLKPYEGETRFPWAKSALERAKRKFQLPRD